MTPLPLPHNTLGEKKSPRATLAENKDPTACSLTMTVKNSLLKLLEASLKRRLIDRWRSRPLVHAFHATLQNVIVVIARVKTA